MWDKLKIVSLRETNNRFNEVKKKIKHERQKLKFWNENGQIKTTLKFKNQKYILVHEKYRLPYILSDFFY